MGGNGVKGYRTQAVTEIDGSGEDHLLISPEKSY
jgi:hypothetical protein